MERILNSGWLRRLLITFSSTASLVLAGGLGVTFLLFCIVSKTEYDQSLAIFNKEANRYVSTLQNLISRAESDLVTLNQLLLRFGTLDAHQLNSVVQPLLAHNPGIRYFAFVRLVQGEEQSAHEQRIRRAYPKFSPKGSSNDEPISIGEQTRHPLIEYLWPAEGQEALIGTDLTFLEGQGEAILQACRSGLPSVSKPSRFNQLEGQPSGFIMLVPLFRAEADFSDDSSRCDALAGYTAAFFDSHALMEHMLAQNLQHQMPMKISLNASHPGMPLIPVANVTNLQAAENAEPAWCGVGFHREPVRVDEKFKAAGTNWHMELIPQGQSERTHFASLLVLGAGGLLSALSAAYLYVLNGRNRQIKRLLSQHLIELRRREELTLKNVSLDNEKSMLERFFREAPGFIAVLKGKNHVFEMANDAYYRLIGRTDIIGKTVREALPELEGQGYFEILDRVYASGEVYVAKGVPIELKPEQDARLVRYLDFVYQPISDENNNVCGIFVQGNDRSEERSAQSKLEYLSTHDALTGLPNHVHFKDLLATSIAYAEKEKLSVGVVVFDLDSFRQVNDCFGQMSGDELLKAVAQRLVPLTGERGGAARLTGDKFAFFYTADTANRHEYFIRSALGILTMPFYLHETEVLLTCSSGVSIFPHDAINATSLIQCADLAMYSAKERGRDATRFYMANMNTEYRGRLQLESDLRYAIERNQLELRYQPQVDLKSGEVVGVEALLRWRHHERGLLGPDEFIEIAERLGLIRAIGDWVLKTACAQVRLWQELGLGQIRLSVNLSAAELDHPDLCETIESHLIESGIPSSQLDIELTESLIMKDIEHTVDILHQLRSLGVQLSIDDFGTGYSSLSYLKRFPIDALKIDRSFISEIPDNPNDAAISDAIISMAHSLGMKVIAEGVETEAQCAFLSRNLCDEIQGYIFSKPVPADEIETVLRECRSLPENLRRLDKPTRTLLLVDDEPSIISALRRQLRTSGYRILTASSGQEGLDVLALNRVDVIISDQRMPNMTGVEFLRTVKQLYPDTVRIVLSGFTELQSVTDAVNEGAIYKFLTKPWDDDLLKEHIEQAFKHKEMEDENRRLALEVKEANHELARANKQLESLLKRQERQIQWSELSLDIVREALQNVPIPVIALDDSDIIAFMNTAAQDLFEEGGALLGNDAKDAIPSMLEELNNCASDTQCAVSIKDKKITAQIRNMGTLTESRGRLITFLNELQTQSS